MRYRKHYGKKSYGKKKGRYGYGVRIKGRGKRIKRYGVSRGGIRM